MILAHMNPRAVIFDADEVWKVMRIRMARWLGVPPRDWDAMTYEDQCVAMEIASAEKEIQAYEQNKARARARTRAARQTR